MATEEKVGDLEVEMEVVAESQPIEEVEEDDPIKKLFDEAEETESENSTKAIPQYQSILGLDRTDDIACKTKEQCIYKLTKLHTESARFDDVIALLNKNGSFFESIPKARTAKIVRNVIDIVATVKDSLDIQIRLCKDVIEWCKLEKRTFLKQRVEAKKLIQNFRELKKLDDKQMLTEVHLTESRIYHDLENIPKAKASLTACRTNANSIYVTPLLQ
eukprot:gene12872-27146_t